MFDTTVKSEDVRTPERTKKADRPVSFSSPRSISSAVDFLKPGGENPFLALQRKEKLPASSGLNQINRTGLPDRLKTGMEALSGYRFDDVRVHYNSPKPAQLQALAYTQGTDIHVAPGQERHLAHEAWHVAQQMQGRVRPTRQVQGRAVNDDPVLEHEADVMGAKAVQGKFAGGAVQLKTAKGGCIQAKLPAVCNWDDLYNGIPDTEVIEDTGATFSYDRTIGDSKKTISRLNRKQDTDYIESLETPYGLRALSYDIKSVKNKVKNAVPGFHAGNEAVLRTAQQAVNHKIRVLEDQKYHTAGAPGFNPNYINQETDGHFEKVKLQSRVMLQQVKGKSQSYLKKYFNPTGNAITDEPRFYANVRDKFQKIYHYLDHMDYKNNYSAMPGVFGYVYPNPDKQTAGTRVGGRNVSGTFIGSRIQNGEETGNQIRLSGAYRRAPDHGRDTKPGVIIHETSHLILGTEDYAYGSNIFTLSSAEAVKNADTYEWAAENA